MYVEEGTIDGGGGAGQGGDQERETLIGANTAAAAAALRVRRGRRGRPRPAKRSRAAVRRKHAATASTQQQLTLLHFTYSHAMAPALTYYCGIPLPPSSSRCPSLRDVNASTELAMPIRQLHPRTAGRAGRFPARRTLFLHLKLGKWTPNCIHPYPSSCSHQFYTTLGVSPNTHILP